MKQDPRKSCFISDQGTGDSMIQGEYLELQDISREQMGAYLCIASNKIPPSVSKRITLIVECEYFCNLNKIYLFPLIFSPAYDVHSKPAYRSSCQYPSDHGMHNWSKSQGELEPRKLICAIDCIDLQWAYQHCIIILIFKW